MHKSFKDTIFFPVYMNILTNLFIDQYYFKTFYDGEITFRYLFNITQSLRNWLFVLFYCYTSGKAFFRVLDWNIFDSN